MERGDVHLVRLSPTTGSEIRKTRPCPIVSPDELNLQLRTVVVAPMTTGGRAYPWRPSCRFQGRIGFIALDQVRTVDKVAPITGTFESVTPPIVTVRATPRGSSTVSPWV